MESVWVPPPEVTGHHGGSIRGNVVFPVSPPQESGRVISAYSSCKPRELQASWKEKVLWFLGAGFVLAVLAMGVRLVLLPSLSQVPVWAVGTLGFLLGISLYWQVLDDTKPLCSFVGEDGFIRLELDKRGQPRGNRAEPFLFSRADDAGLAVLEKAANGTNTWVTAEWRSKGKNIFKLFFIHDEPRLPSPSKTGKDTSNAVMDCYYAIAAHRAWELFAARN